MGFLRTLLALVALVALYQGVKFATRRTVVVPARGAVLITGVSSGIGLHAAVALAASHPHLTVVGTLRKEADMALFKQACASCVPLLMDMASEASIADGVEALATLLGERGDGAKPLP